LVKIYTVVYLLSPIAATGLMLKYFD
jgi:hypothetical protein